MHYLLLLAFLWLGNPSFSQQLSAEQQAVLTQFDLNTQDHRSVEFQLAAAENTAQYTSVLSAIEGFFTTQIKRDYTILTVSSAEAQYLNSTFSILQLVDLHINLSPSN